MDKKYQEWIEVEKQEAHEAFQRYRADGDSRQWAVGSRQWAVGSGQAGSAKFRGWIIRTAAAVLVLAMGTGIWLKREAIFGPKYPEDQVELAYEHTIKILSRYSESLSSSTSPFKNLNLDDTDDL